MGQTSSWPDCKVETRRPAIWHYLVRRLLAITSRQQQTRRTLLDWPRVECGIEKPSNKLLALTELESNTTGGMQKEECRMKNEGRIALV
jgi:hypothetical protein